ncbi:glucose-inhibited division protein A [Blastopirellula marina DSM 3645]|uniref:Glucose-inhibited division protein A n=1 Tax=Blastopirellula marina DSM 3645 TaxID=314230 RepID=A3ZZK9_9BACT|nr:glucose-inhibited division protein A [Blastopirellula marina DSM 3645]
MDAARVRDAIQVGLSDAKAGRVKPARQAIKKLAK